MYRIIVDEETHEQVTALPTDLLPDYAAVLDVLVLAPWSGDPYDRGKPTSPMRRISFGPDGRGEVIYLVFEDQQRVDLLRVYWL